MSVVTIFVLNPFNTDTADYDAGDFIENFDEEMAQVLVMLDNVLILE